MAGTKKRKGGRNNSSPALAAYTFILRKGTFACFPHGDLSSLRKIPHLYKTRGKSLLPELFMMRSAYALGRGDGAHGVPEATVVVVVCSVFAAAEIKVARVIGID